MNEDKSRRRKIRKGGKEWILEDILPVHLYVQELPHQDHGH